MTNLEKCYPSNRNLSVDYPINFHPKAKRKLKKKKKKNILCKLLVDVNAILDNFKEKKI